MKIIEEIIKFFKEPKNPIMLIIGPILLTFLIGGVYIKDYMKDIPIAVLDMDNSSTSRLVVKQFEENERYYVSKHTNSFDELKSVMDQKKAYMGLYIPKDFNKNLKKLQSSNVLVILDGSNVTIGNTALAPATEILATINGGIQMKIMQAKNFNPKTSMNLAKIFNFESRILYDPKLTYKGYIMPGIILVFIQQLFLSIFAAKVSEDPQNILIKAIIYSVASIISYLSCILIMKTFLGVVIRGDLKLCAAYAYIFLIALSGPAVVIASLFKDRLKITQFCMLLSMPTFLTAGYVWPVEQMPIIVLKATKFIWPLIYALAPIRDIMIKNSPIQIFESNIKELVVYAVFWISIGYILSKVLLKKEELIENGK